MAESLHLEQLISREIEAVGQFIALLKEEEKALQSLTPEGLDVLGEKKIAALKNIEHLEKERALHLNEACLKNPIIKSKNEELLKLANEVKRQNQANGKQLMRHLERTSEALATLIQKEKTSLYGSDGQTQNSPIGRNLGSA